MHVFSSLDRDWVWGWDCIPPPTHKHQQANMCKRAHVLGLVRAQVATTLKARATVIEGYGAWVRLGGGGTGDREDSARTLPPASDLAAHPLTAAALQVSKCPQPAERSLGGGATVYIVGAAGSPQPVLGRTPIGLAGVPSTSEQVQQLLLLANDDVAAGLQAGTPQVRPYGLGVEGDMLESAPVLPGHWTPPQTICEHFENIHVLIWRKALGAIQAAPHTMHDASVPSPATSVRTCCRSVAPPGGLKPHRPTSVCTIYHPF